MKRLLLLLMTCTPLIAQEYCEPSHRFDCGFKYVKLGGSIISIGERTGGGVTVAAGWRFLEGCSGADLSLAFLVGRASDDSSAYAYLTPSIRYLHYLSPRVYIGGGLAYGNTGARHHKFRGILANGTLGYELFRGRQITQFLELELYQPAIRTSKKKETLYAPSLALSFGMGF